MYSVIHFNMHVCCCVGSQVQVSTNWSSTTATILTITLSVTGVLTIGTCALAVLLVVVLVTKKKMAAIQANNQQNQRCTYNKYDMIHIEREVCN